LINKITNVELLHNSIRLNRKEEQKKQFHLLPKPRQAKDSFESSESAVKTKPKDNKGLPFWQAGLAGGLLLVLGIVGTGSYFKWGAKATTPITNSAEEGLGKLKNLLPTLPENAKIEDIVTAVEQKINVLNQETQKLVTKLASANEDLACEVAKKESAEQAIKQATLIMNKQSRDINILETQIASLKLKPVEALSNEAKTQLEQEIERLTQELSLAQVNVEQLTIKLKKAEEKIGKHFEKSTAFEDTIRELKEQIMTLTKEKEKQALLLNADIIREALETLPTLSSKITPQMALGDTILTQEEMALVLKAIALEEDANFLGAGRSKAYGLPAHIDPNQDYSLLIYGGLEGAKPADLVKVGDPNLEDLPNVSALVATAGNMKLLKRVSGLATQQPHRKTILTGFSNASNELQRLIGNRTPSTNPQLYLEWQKLENINPNQFKEEQELLRKVQEDYVNYVKNLTALPDQSWLQFFNTAKTLAERGYELDLTHPNNILVDFERQTLGFVDLQENANENSRLFSPQRIVNSFLWHTGGDSWIGYSIQDQELATQLRTNMHNCIDKINRVLSSIECENLSIGKGIDVSKMNQIELKKYSEAYNVNDSSNRGEFLLGKPITDYFEFHYNDPD